MTAHCLIQLQEVFYQTHSAAPAYNTEEFNGAQSRGRKKKKTEAEAALPPPRHSHPPSRTDAPVYHFIPKRLYTLKQTVETVIVRAQLSCTVHLLDC